MKKIVLMFVLLGSMVLAIVSFSTSARAFEVKIEDSYFREQYLSRYVNCSGFVQSKTSGLISNWGTNVRFVDAGIFSGVYNVDFWNFSAFKGGWLNGEGNNEIDWTILKLGDFSLGDKKVSYQIGAAYLDLGEIFNGFRGDYLETIMDFLVPVYATQNFSTNIHARNETLFSLGTKDGTAGTFNYLGFYTEYRWGRVTFSAQTDLVIDDGLITTDPAGIFLLRPAISLKVIDNPKNRLDVEVASRTTFPVISGDKRDGIQTGVYAGMVWKPRFMNW